ncbi:carbamoyl-phosphate synthase domain-containing protein [Secundilactobacillus silagei]|uniref:carbamoyl-phosphate synthase domain-containing protein n=1 Tax=Secundilactobacillus silagei TaxID=1293415 RepID=UPI000ABC89E3|nr:carbamoyl-phosphate synthase domain-containing protein [Secundilactobacillus silagei]
MRYKWHNVFLILEDGSIYPGHSFGAGATTTGEIVFNTSMLGYQEIVTNQIYHNQIIVFFTADHWQYRYCA